MWAHMLTIPRQVTLQRNRLVQQPLEELKKLRLGAETLEQEHNLSSRAFELELSVDPDFTLTFSNRKGESVTFSSNGRNIA